MKDIKNVEKRICELVTFARKRRKLKDEDTLYMLTVPHRTEHERLYLERLKPVLQSRYNIAVVELVRDHELRPMALMLQVSKDLVRKKRKSK